MNCLLKFLCVCQGIVTIIVWGADRHTFERDKLTFSLNHAQDFKWNLNNLVRKHVYKVWECTVNIVHELKKPHGVSDHLVAHEITLECKPPLWQLSPHDLGYVVADFT